MDNAPLSKYTVSFGLSVALCSVINALLVIAKENSPAVQAAMQRMTGHHWVTHSAIVLVLFGFLGWLFAKANGGQGLKISPSHLISMIVTGVVAGGLVITGFYLVGD
ncbi:MAG TPA: hypothetical protein VMV72_19485 [Verrucomicrobiae bacterium]|nr:hypothetical protein [Verrucomicrobiae bacterium]